MRRAALIIALLLASRLTAQEPKTIHKIAGLEIEVVGDLQGFSLALTPRRLADGLDVVKLELTRAEPAPPPRFSLRWAVPSHDVSGHWMTGRQLGKTIRPDWSGGRLQASMFAREAPVSCLFGSSDQNVLTFAVADALDTLLVGSGIREEDGFVYNDVVFFSERHASLEAFTTELRIDRRNVRYEKALQDVADWWASQPGYAPASVPAAARLPVYSTWYNYHQGVDSAVLLKEVAAAKPLGFDSIIVDDGWQTRDSARGYAFTGDWEPERMPDMRGFVDGCHKLGVKVVLWYAVPFVGKNAKVVDRFKGKSLRFEERLGAYVLDPRYPEVRRYLIDTYERAVRVWDIDGFKLDFIERFSADESTVLEAAGGRDFGSVNEATDRMMTDIMAALRARKPDVMIEFRQPYIGPLIRKYGNMLRASDCPNSYLMNRVKTTDVRLLAGGTAVHADMIMWHPGEPVEVAALQLLNILFSVPQVSVRLQEIPKDHLEMLRFYTDYWRSNRSVLLDGELQAAAPLSNYPALSGRTAVKQIVALFDDRLVRLDERVPARLDVVNAKASDGVTLDARNDLGTYRYEVKDCRGRSLRKGELRLAVGPHSLAVPRSGLIALERAGS